MASLPEGTSAWPVIVRQWHWQSRISIGKLQSRAQTFKLRHADKGLKNALAVSERNVWCIVFLYLCVRSGSGV
jgi:hypothetical protein